MAAKARRELTIGHPRLNFAVGLNTAQGGAMPRVEGEQGEWGMCQPMYCSDPRRRRIVYCILRSECRAFSAEYFQSTTHLPWSPPKPLPL